MPFLAFHLPKSTLTMRSMSNDLIGGPRQSCTREAGKAVQLRKTAKQELFASTTCGNTMDRLSQEEVAGTKPFVEITVLTTCSTEENFNSSAVKRRKTQPLAWLLHSSSLQQHLHISTNSKLLARQTKTAPTKKLSSALLFYGTPAKMERPTPMVLPAIVGPIQSRALLQTSPK